MCGIFGWLPSLDNQRCDFKAVASSQFQALAHRGPNDQGFALFSGQELLSTEKKPADYVTAAGTLLLGQTRLSIIDLSSAGHQPMFSQDGRYCLVYDGEVYNYLELREELKAQGLCFVSHTDTEVVLQALIHWGLEALNRFSGMFAFAFFDKQEQRLFFARDLFGIKPLFYGLTSDSFAFASELPALMLMPGIERRLNWSTAKDYLLYGSANVGGLTMVDGINQLPPGYFMEVQLTDLSRAVLQPYWKFHIGQPLQISFQEAAEELRRIFLESVRLHLRADVSLGVALSGGIDSSAVVCALRHLWPSSPILGFSYVASGQTINEEKWVDLVAGHVNAQVHKVLVDPDELLSDLPDLISKQGEPFASTSTYAQYRVFRMARENGMGVIIDGQGADEVFGGYRGYPRQRFQSLIRQGYIRRAIRVMEHEALRRNRPGLRSKSRAYTRTLNELIRLLKTKLLSSDFSLRKKRKDSPPWLRPEARRIERQPGFFWPGESPANPYVLRETLLKELTWDSVPALLRDGDRNSMAFSMESRVPFCSRELVEFSLSLPEEYLVTDEGLTKAVFRQSMRGLVPDAILDRRDKIGFATPERDWFLNLSGWVEENLHKASSSAILDDKVLLNEWKQIQSGHRPFDWRVWRWINYLNWREIFNVSE